MRELHAYSFMNMYVYTVYIANIALRHNASLLVAGVQNLFDFERVQLHFEEP